MQDFFCFYLVPGMAHGFSLFSTPGEGRPRPFQAAGGAPRPPWAAYS